jgi:hypothetical protein
MSESETIAVKKYCGCGRLSGHSEACEFKESTELRINPLHIPEPPLRSSADTEEINKVKPLSSPRLIARNHEEMLAANESIKQWMSGKIALLKVEAKELTENLEAAKKNKWRTSGFNSALNRVKQSIAFYQKIQEAVEHGYTIIPDFPIDVFAIRTSRESPLAQDYFNKGASWDNTGQHPAQSLESGKGNYVNPFPTRLVSKEIEKDPSGKEIITRHFWSDSFKELEFPVTAVHPEVLSATQQAMALRVFDEIGICPETRKADPMIIGRILRPKVGWTQKSCSFLIAWFLDVRTL